MADSTTAVVETITAEVRVLMVGSRQVTAGVYGQLDMVEPCEIIPFGRVTPKDAQAGHVYIAGKHKETGELVRSCTPCSEDKIWDKAKQGSEATRWDKAADTADTAAADQLKRADKAEQDAADQIERDSTYYATAQRGDRRAAEAQTLADAATTELERLEHLAKTAEERHSAAKCRALAADYQAKAADYREEAKRLGEIADKRRDIAEQWNQRDVKAETDLTTLADKWMQLPLIVLAGLR